ncbi:MAG: ABC transporter ATP-binding protein [Gemmataceae bacterium]|nr:ABC transporter ATP-binding protein [Gemmataceae bacterium]
MTPAIRADNLSKCYRLQTGPRGGANLTEALVGTARNLFGRLRGSSVTSGREDFWALKDVSFDVKPGESVGIIGRNGAGKSTLLKVLSRIVEPTGGRAEVRGRMGSLLEVGTGFHPELSGRENVFLNGSILGMSGREIRRKFDEIVAFAEIDKFLDTPVKRYSSGMYVRLAFAVAAHLEPEILIVDEVLAVGDAAFQEKCLGKMKEVERSGRTILFVSHSAQAIAQLTSRCLLMEAGRCAFDGPTHDALAAYTRRGGSKRGEYETAAGPAKHNRVRSARVLTSDPEGLHRWGKPVAFEFELEVIDPADGLSFSFQVVDPGFVPVAHFWMFDSGNEYGRRPGVYRLRCEVPKLRLFMGNYTLTTWLTDRAVHVPTENLVGVCGFEVSMLWQPRDRYDYAPGDCKYVEDCTWAPVERV